MYYDPSRNKNVGEDGAVCWCKTGGSRNPPRCQDYPYNGKVAITRVTKGLAGNNNAGGRPICTTEVRLAFHVAQLVASRAD